jgi:purine nucleosidase
MERLFGLRGFYSWDVLAGVYLTHLDLFKDRQCQVISNAEHLKTGFLQIVSERDKGYILSIPDALLDRRSEQTVASSRS